MSVAFRIRTSAGQELSFASRASFEDFVRSGDLSPEDLVYDGETGSWSPSRTHPIVLEIEYENEEAATEGAADNAAEGGAEAAAPVDQAEGEGEADAVEPAAAPTEPVSATTDEPSGGDADDPGVGEGVELGLSLAPVKETPAPIPEVTMVDGGVPEIERPIPSPEAGTDGDGSGDEVDLDLAPLPDASPEEDSQAFVDKLEGNFDFGAGGSAGGAVRMENRGSMGEMITPSTEVTAPREEKARPKPRGAPSPRPAPARRQKGGAGLVAAIAVVAAGSYFGYTTFLSEPDPVPEVPPNQPVEPIVVTPAPAPDPTPAISRTEVDVRDRARERYLTASQLLIRDLPSVPESWATTGYFVMPSEHPHVVPLWESYLVAIRTVREQDRDRYALAYNGAMDEARITGEERAQRLTVALSAFDSASVRREAHYDRVEALSTAAIQSHGVLIGAEGLLLTDATAEGGPGGLGAGVSGRDADAQLLLDQVIDVLSARLSASGLGPRTGTNVREWIWDGFLGAVTTPG